MAENYKTIYSGGSAEIIEKKSRFIANISPVETEEDAVAFIDAVKKKYRDATHNCTAYTVGMRHEISHCSDDGEPSKTAGRPMLDVLFGEDIHNICVVVTRYFGGTLLGTGGLVRAYQGALKAGLENCKIINKCFGKRFLVKTDYNGIGKLQYIASSMQAFILSTDYTDIVEVKLLLPPELENAFLKKFNEAVSGKADVSLIDEVYYAELDGEVLIF